MSKMLKIAIVAGAMALAGAAYAQDKKQEGMGGMGGMGAGRRGHGWHGRPGSGHGRHGWHGRRRRRSATHARGIVAGRAHSDQSVRPGTLHFQAARSFPSLTGNSPSWNAGHPDPTTVIARPL